MMNPYLTQIKKNLLRMLILKTTLPSKKLSIDFSKCRKRRVQKSKRKMKDMLSIKVRRFQAQVGRNQITREKVRTSKKMEMILNTGMQ
jgi:cobalamin biosynthesis protein CobD/CbiB